MKINCLAGLAVALLCGALWGQVAVIDGPSEALTGKIFVLDSARSEGDFRAWIWENGGRLDGGRGTVEEKYAEPCGDKLIVAAPVPGVYWFHLAVSNAKGISTVSHQVKVSGSIVDPPPVDPPDPPPVGSYKPIEDASRAGAVALADPPTAAAIVANYGQLVWPARLEAAQVVAVDAVESALAARQGASRFKDWLGLWRRPVNDAIAAIGVSTVDEYKLAIAAAARGLNSAPVAVVIPPRKTPVHVRQDIWYDQRPGHWTYPGDIASHLQSSHGQSVAGLSRTQMLNLHDALHEGTAGSYRPAPAAAVGVYCPNGICPTNRSRAVFRWRGRW